MPGEPVSADRARCHLPRLEILLREFPTIDIVITSMWRYTFSLAQLRAQFAEDIRSRVIGITATAERIDQASARAPRARDSQVAGGACMC